MTIDAATPGDRRMHPANGVARKPGTTIDLLKLLIPALIDEPTKVNDLDPRRGFLVKYIFFSR